jgi:hypothetical protein
VKCDDNAEDIFTDWEKYAPRQTNYEQKFIKCPDHCWVDQKVDGLGSHPQKSPLCASAMVDDQMPFSGGIVAINKIPR